jgi:X-Pro dipeptidyl-peptidase
LKVKIRINMKKDISLKILFLCTAIVWCALNTTKAQNATQKTVPVFVDGEAQIVPGFSDPDKWIVHDLWVETEFDTDGDGRLDRMHVDVTRPEQTETEGLKLPVVYNTSPYFAGTAGPSREYFWDVRHEIGATPPVRPHPAEIKRRGERPVISKAHVDTWAPRGYIVVHSSSPGTGLSQGAPTVGGDNESLAPKAVIDWLCGRANGYTTPDGQEKVEAYWSTGKVGMTGTSYNGTLPIAAATTGVEGLEAIIPVAPNTSYYHYYRSYGLIRSPGGYLGEDIDVLYDFIHSGDESKRAYNNATVRDKEMKEGMDRITGDYNDFWAGRDYLNDMGPFKAALLMSHGFNDWNVMPEHSFRIYEAAKAKGLPVQIYYHQGGHGGPPPISLMNRWFTRYLHGVENGVENDPKAWIVREEDERDDPTPYADYRRPEPATQLQTG